jgi:uncharacterized protein (DUF1330 family)
MSITPNEAQFIQLAVDAEAKPGEVVMLNLLKFKPEADGDGGPGADAYGKYGSTAVKMVNERGGRVLWAGSPSQVLIGDVDANEWDAVVLVSYPNRSAFIDMVSQPEYLEAHEHREGGLDRTVLLAMTPGVQFAPAVES